MGTPSTRYHAHSRRMFTAFGCLVAVGFLGLLSMKSSSTPTHRRLPNTKEELEKEIKDLQTKVDNLEKEINGKLPDDWEIHEYGQRGIYYHSHHASHGQWYLP